MTIDLWHDIEARRGTCADCGISGVHVDTTAGEIVGGGVVAKAPAHEEWLMVDPDGTLRCAECSDE